ncbi:MAG: carboxylesterase family protein, partial [Chloroflexota bacterium]
MMFLRQPYRECPAAEMLGESFAAEFAPAGAGQLAALRQIPAERLYERLRQAREFQYFYPVIDGYVLEKGPYEAFLDGDQARAPLLLGSNADEGSLFFPIYRTPISGYEDVPAKQVAGLIQDEFGDDAEAMLDLYPGLEKGTDAAQTDLMGDSVFGAAVHFYASCAARAGQPVYLYHFTRRPPSPKQTAGAYHAAELTFVHDKALPLFEWSEADEALAQAMGDYWTEFARSGDPNLPSRPEWAAFSEDNPRQMRLGLGNELGMTEIDRLAKYELVQRRLLRLIDGMKRLRQPEKEVVTA